MYKDSSYNHQFGAESTYRLTTDRISVFIKTLALALVRHALRSILIAYNAGSLALAPSLHLSISLTFPVPIDFLFD
jgi:hypothetical protein